MSSRNGRPYRTLKAQLRRHHAEHNSPCHLCRKPINYLLRWPDPGSFTVDHIVPVWAGGTDTAENLAPCHAGCNASRGAVEGNRTRKRPTPTSGRPCPTCGQPVGAPLVKGGAQTHTSRRW